MTLANDQTFADWRAVLEAERRALPVQLLLLLAASGSLVATSDGVLLWLGATLLSASLRQIAARRSVAGQQVSAGRLIVTLYAVDAFLWAALLLGLPASHGTNSVPAVAAAGAILQTAMVLRQLPRAWTALVVGWLLMSVVTTLFVARVTPIFTFGFPLWLFAVGWSGRASARQPLRGRRPGESSGEADAEAMPAADSAASPEEGAQERGERSGEILARLPGLVWNVDSLGRVIEMRGEAPWRWGLKVEVEKRPLWNAAFEFDETCRADVERALAGAIAGQSTFDVLNRRTTRNGAVVMLRSHFVPFSLPPAAGPGATNASALVMDTIASPQGLLEIERLRRSRAQYKSLVDASASLIWACDAQYRLTFASRRAAREIYRCEPHHLIGRNVAKLLADGISQPEAVRAFAGLRAGESMRDVEMVHGSFDGGQAIVAVTAAGLRGNDGSFLGAVGTVTDLTVLKQREVRLAEALQVERTVLDAAGEAIAVVKGGKTLRCNDAFLRLLQADPVHLARGGLTDHFERTEDWAEITAAAEAARGEDRAAIKEVQILRGGREEGTRMWCQITARMVAPGECVIVLVDIDQMRRRETDALHVAHHDELTGLPNRRLLAARAQTALTAAAAGHGMCAVMAVDLDGFKAINDRYGHRMGDTVLREIAQRLLRVVRPDDTVARRGGDEFAILLPDVGTRADAERVASRLLHAVAQPLTLTGGREGGVSASIGIALAPQQGRDLERLLQVADAAMYQAKLAGKNRYELHGAVGQDAPRAAQLH